MHVEAHLHGWRELAEQLVPCLGVAQVDRLVQELAQPEAQVSVEGVRLHVHLLSKRHGHGHGQSEQQCGGQIVQRATERMCGPE